MIIGCGIDIIEIDRIEDVLNANSNFITRIFCNTEIEYIKIKKSNTNTIAGLFAAKEAISKALGSGIRDFKWKDIEIYHDNLGKPFVRLYNNAKIIASSKNIDTIHISITHDKDKAAAFAIAEGKKLAREYDNKHLISNQNNAIVIDKELVGKCLPNRKSDTHKGTYGRVGIIAGSKGMTGASTLAAMAALRSGSGLVYSLIPSSISNILEMKLTEAIVVPIKDMSKGYFNRDSIEHLLKYIDMYDCIALGPGIGVDYERVELVKRILTNYKKTLILDADGINCISEDVSTLINRKETTILTPHPGELSRLMKIDISEIQKNRVRYCSLASKKFGAITILKGANTVICDDKGDIYLNITGNPGMATAGCGDVLTGMISSFIGQGISPIQSVVLGVYLHGLAGDLAKEDKGEYGMIASDVVENIPYAIKAVQIIN